MSVFAQPTLWNSDTRRPLDDVWGYQWHHLKQTVRSVVGPHRLLIDKPFPIYEGKFYLDATEQRRWHKLFAVESEQSLPFTYCLAVATNSFKELMINAGINLWRCQHVRSEMRFQRACLATELNQSYRYTLEISDLVPLDTNRVVVILDTRIYNAQDRICAAYEEFFVVSDLDSENVREIRIDARFGRHSLETIKITPQPRLNGSNSTHTSYRVAPHIPLDFGYLSGDLDAINVSRILAKFAGHRSAILQEACTVNLMLKHLNDYAQHPIEAYDLTFVAPIYSGDTLDICIADTAFEVFNKRGDLVVTGTWQ